MAKILIRFRVQHKPQTVLQLRLKTQVGYEFVWEKMLIGILIPFKSGKGPLRIKKYAEEKKHTVC